MRRSATPFLEEISGSQGTVVNTRLAPAKGGKARLRRAISALATARGAGVWLAQRYIACGVTDPLAAYERSLRVFAWNIPGITVERSGDGVSIRILSPRFSESYTVLFNRYLVGILVGCGYEVTFNEIGKGNILRICAKV